VELSRRARECVEAIEKVPHVELMGAAACVLVARAPAGAAEALIAYLPFADDEYLEEALIELLTVAGLSDGKPVAAVKAAVADRDPMRRAAAAAVIGRAAPAHRGPLAELAKDADPRVRYRAALGLLRGGEASAVAVLARLLTEAPLPLAWRAEDVLMRLAGEKAPNVALGKGDEPERKSARAAWEHWWEANRAATDLAKVNLDDPSLGLTLFCEDERIGESPGFVFAVNRAGTVIWKLEGINSPADFHLLPGGRVLIAENWHSKVTERDRRGKVLWERKLDDKPVSCERLPNGNTFVATYRSLHEFTPDGKEVFSHRPSGMLHGGYKQRDGHFLTVDTNGTVVELDAKGAELHRFQPEKYASGAGNWASVEVLPNGRYLIALSGTNRVIETDRMGNVLWEKEVQTPTSATRLRNGHTLVSSVEGGFVVEWDAAGNEVWRFKSTGRPFRVRRY
jgi:hypothetical protein